jgi:hypothetical protein
MIPLAIMFKESFDTLNLNLLGVTALVIFVVTFIATAVWAARQERAEVQRWSNLPLDDDHRQLDVEEVPLWKDRP